jgi:hypothetical protein
MHVKGSISDAYSRIVSRCGQALVGILVMGEEGAVISAPSRSLRKTGSSALGLKVGNTVQEQARASREDRAC